MKLFCFPIAGGNINFFNQLEQCLEPEISVVKLEYSGHGKRYKEPFYKSFYELADDLYKEIYRNLKEGRELSEKYAFLGYSMGSISVVEVLQKIVNKGELTLPSYIFLAAHEPKAMVEISRCNLDEIDEFVKNRTIRFGGLPETLVNNKSFWRVYLPVYRADYSMIGKYDFSKLTLKTKIPATVFYSETDTSYSDMEEWKNYFVGECEFICYEGDHFFIQEHCREIAEIIKAKRV